MHERAAITRAVAELVMGAGGSLRRVEALVGPGVDLDVVRDVWLQAAAGTTAEGADLRCVRTDDVLSCLECEAEYAGDKLTVCPACGSDGLVVRAAPVFAVRSWEVS